MMTSRSVGWNDGDEITFIQSVRTEQFDHLDFTFFASDQNGTRKNWKTARDAGSAIVDFPTRSRMILRLRSALPGSSANWDKRPPLNCSRGLA